MNTLNIPIELIKNYKTSKARKELLAFAIAIKCIYSNSVLIDVSIKKIMRLFHVSNGKARRLLNEAKESSLFSYDRRNNQLRVNSFKDRSVKLSKNGIKYISDYCYKIVKSSYSIADLCKILSNILIKNAIHAVQMDKLIKSGKTSNNPSCAYKKGLNQRRLTTISGLSLSSVSRSLKAMWQRGEIEKTGSHAKMVISCVNAETVNEWRQKHGSRKFFHNKKDNTGYIFVPSVYTLNDSSAKFTNVIYNHKKRMDNNVSNTGCVSDIERFYSTIHAF